MTKTFFATPTDFKFRKGLAELHRKRAPLYIRTRALWYAGTMALLFGSALAYPSKIVAFAPILIFAITALYFGAGFAWRRQMFAGFQSAPYRLANTRFTLAEDGYSEESALHSMTFRWNAFIAADQTNEGIALLLADIECLAIPKTAFKDAGEMAETLTVIKAYIAASRG
jgi:hypothetical protein